MTMFSAATTINPSDPSTSPPNTTQLDPKTQAIKTRILTHMSTDHSDSLALYLRHYCHLPSSQIPLHPPPPVGTLQLTDITLDHIIVTHPFGRNFIPITPPMTSLSESRERLVAMHNTCLTALNLAPFKVDRFVPPNKPWQWITHFATFVTFFTFSLWPASAFRPGQDTFPSKFWSFGGLANWNATLASVIKDYVLVGMLVIHLAEVVWFARTRLRRYWVARFSAVWWAWTGIVFLGGVAGWTRFDEYVSGIEREREGGKGKGQGKGKH